MGAVGDDVEAADDGASVDGDADHIGPATSRWRIGLRRVVVAAVVVAQVAFVVRAYWAPHREFGYQMFPESSQWSAEISRVSGDAATGDLVRVSIEDGWFGYRWTDLVDGRGLDVPWRRHHADSGLGRQLEFLQEALDWVARNTPNDTETDYLEAVVTTWPNLGDAEIVVLRSVERDPG